MTGNYWLDLIRLEKLIKQQIELVVQKYVGKAYPDPAALKESIVFAIARQLDILSKKESLSPFEVDYDVQMQFSGDILAGFEVTNVTIS